MLQGTKEQRNSSLFLKPIRKKKSISTISYLQANQMVHIASQSVSNSFFFGPALLLNFENDVMYVSRMK